MLPRINVQLEPYTPYTQAFFNGAQDPTYIHIVSSFTQQNRVSALFRMARLVHLFSQNEQSLKTRAGEREGV